jgi:hypothetical protein
VEFSLPPTSRLFFPLFSELFFAEFTLGKIRKIDPELFNQGQNWKIGEGGGEKIP